MKKIMLVILMAVVMSTPSLAVIGPDGFVSIDGTAWRAAERDDLDFAFHDGALYVNCLWMGVSEGDCTEGELIPIDSVIREPGRIGVSIHFSPPFSTYIYRFEVVDLEDNTGSMDLWYVELWPSCPNPFFILSPGLIFGDKLRGLGIYRHYTYGSSWQDVSPVLLFKVHDDWMPAGE